MRTVELEFTNAKPCICGEPKNWHRRTTTSGNKTTYKECFKPNSACKQYTEASKSQ